MPETMNSEMFDPMYAALRELGLTENEQRLYVLSLQSGPTSISLLATQLGLPRPNLYKIITGLGEKGLADASVRNRYTRRFMVEPPSKISELLQARRDAQAAVDHAFIEKMPSYVAQFRQGEGPMKVRLLVGQKDFIAAFNQMFEETTDELCYFGSVTELSKGVPRTVLEQNIGRRVARQIHTKALMLPGDRDFLTPQQHEAQMREVRYLQDVPPFTTSFHLFANKVVLWQPHAPMALLVEDEYLVAMMRSIFFTLWAQGVA